MCYLLPVNLREMCQHERWPNWAKAVAQLARAVAEAGAKPSGATP